MGNHEIEQIAHLMRRAGFGATRDQLDNFASRGYEATVEQLLDQAGEQRMGDDVIRRFHPELSGMMGPQASGENWLYRMVTTTTPLREKVCLFWHGIFATGYPKVIHGKALSDQIRMFRRYGMDSFRDLLLELAKDPAMIIWLDNQDNHKDAINENFGRELLELFSMGVGNYTEQDIKECARAFTGWTLGNREYMELRSMRDSDWPYGRISWHFEFQAEDHDDGEKEFLGQRGRFNGEDIVDIICQQEATARFISRHMYSFFVADEPPVPEWPYTPPADPAAIDMLAQVYFDSGYNISAMLRALFNSDFFKAGDSWYGKVKSPIELVAGVLRLSGEFDRPRKEILDRYQQAVFMGQYLNNPPSVEGWHQGADWIDTGSLVERVNFASQQLGDVQRPGVQAMISRIEAAGQPIESSESLVDACLDQVGAISVSEATRQELINFASLRTSPHAAVPAGERRIGSVPSVGRPEMRAGSLDDAGRQRVADVIQMVASTHEFQRA